MSLDSDRRHCHHVRVSDRAHIRYTKYDGSLHWHYDADELATDEHGRWFVMHPGSPYRRGEEDLRHTRLGWVLLVPQDAWWSVEFNVEPIASWHVYVNINTPAVVEEDGVIGMVDLDLDVALGRDGVVRLLDEDEFAEHRTRYGYPEHLVDRARTAAAETFVAVEHRTEPFARAGARRLAEGLGWAHGTVVAGHGAASGGDSRFPDGTLALQAPHFAGAGIDLSAFEAGTINVDLDHLRLEAVAPRATVRDVRWHPDAPPEDFSFLDARLAARGEVHDGLIYLPHLETKPDHLQPPNVVEVLAPRIDGLAPGDRVSVWIDPDEGRFALDRQEP